jgi:hypothetical protein
VYGEEREKDWENFESVREIKIFNLSRQRKVEYQRVINILKAGGKKCVRLNLQSEILYFDLIMYLWFLDDYKKYEFISFNGIDFPSSMEYESVLPDLNLYV